jgi:centractin
VTDYLQILLRKNGYRFTTTAEKEIVRTIKEKVCLVSMTPGKDEKENLNKPADFALPDGNIIKVPSPETFLFYYIYFFILLIVVYCFTHQVGVERFAAPELLFNPEMIGDESPGVHELLLESITKVDLDLRRDLFSNIYLAGGSTLFKGPSSFFLPFLLSFFPFFFFCNGDGC